MSQRPIGISVYGPIIEGAELELQGVGKAKLNSSNYALFNVPDDWTASHLIINVEGYEPYSRHLDLESNSRMDFILSSAYPDGSVIASDHPIIYISPLKKLSQPSPTLSPILVEGKEFIRNGLKYRPKGCTDFLLVYKEANGIDISPFLEQRAELGFDLVRIFTMCKNIAPFDPRNYDVAEVVGRTLQKIHSFGLIAEVEGIADADLLGLNESYLISHHMLLNSVILGEGALDLYDLGNEYEKNGFEPSHFLKPNGIISSSGSRINNLPPNVPYWDFCTFHPRRDGEDPYFSKWRTDISPSAELYVGWERQPAINKPIIADEPRGFDETNVNGKRSNYPPYAYQLGWLYYTFLNSSVFHSTQGLTSELFTDKTLECAKAYIKGCRDAEQGLGL